jgi:uncharacterized RDD family membrane protein YckC
MVEPLGTPFSKPLLNLAGPLERFAAVVIDNLLNLAASLPCLILIIVSVIVAADEDEPPPMFYIGFGLAFLGSLMLNVYQWILISRQGQSIGKRIMKLKIVMCYSAQPPGFVYGVLLRVWVNALFSAIPCGIGLIYTIVDLCFVFREDRRCVHDHLAKTCVVHA